MKKSTRLKNEIIALYLALIMILLIVLLLQSALFSYPRILEQTNDYMQEKNWHLRTYIEGYFREIINSVNILAKNIDVIEAPFGDVQAQDRARALFKEFRAANPNIYYIYAGYTNNLLLINDYEPPPGYSVFVRPWYKSVMDKPESGNMTVGLLYREIQTNELLISTIHILESPRYGFTGALAIDSYTQNIAASIQGYSGGFKTLYSFVTDKNFTILVHPNQDYLEKNFYEIIKTSKSLKPGSFIRYKVGNESKIAFVSFMELTNWYIFTTISEKEIFVPIIHNLALYLFFTAFIALLFIGANLWGIRKKVLRPLSTLLKRVENLARGIDNPESVSTMPDNEIGTIAKTIEQLTVSALYQKNKELMNSQDIILKINDELEIKNKILENLATHDVLTGVYNRRKLEEIMLEEYQKHKRYKTPYSIIMFDIDNFKYVNDTFGHDVGDDILKLASRLVSENVRKADTFGRWGGEEFIILLFNTVLTEAVEVAEKLRTIIDATPFPHQQKLTISLGVVEISEGEHLDDLIKRADIYLYKAKECGKNKVAWK